jgi:hypothetical protein
VDRIRLLDKVGLANFILLCSLFVRLDRLALGASLCKPQGLLTGYPLRGVEVERKVIGPWRDWKLVHG